MPNFSFFWQKHYGEIGNCCMTYPLKKLAWINPDNKESVPRKFEGKQLVIDFIDVNWMYAQKLKWIGWDIQGWLAWTDARGMLYRIKDLKRNEVGQEFEKEVNEVKCELSPMVHIGNPSAEELYRFERDMQRKCGFCPDGQRSGPADEQQEKLQETRKPPIVPAWEKFVSGDAIVEYGPAGKEMIPLEVDVTYQIALVPQIPMQPKAPHIQLNNYPGFYEPLHGEAPQENKPKEKTGQNIGQLPPPPEKLEIDCETLKDYAEMAADEYYEISKWKGNNWRRANEKLPQYVVYLLKYFAYTGIHGDLYVHIQKNGSSKYVFVFRGSELKKNDWINNYAQLIGTSMQYKVATLIAEKLKETFKTEISFIGHSLGGGLASLAALVTGLPAVTFNAAGLSKQTKDSYKTTNAKINAYIVKDEIANVLQAGASKMQAEGNKIMLDPGNSYIEKKILAQSQPEIDALSAYIKLSLGQGLPAKTVPQFLGLIIRVKRHTMSTVLEILNKNCP